MSNIRIFLKNENCKMIKKKKKKKGKKLPSSTTEMLLLFHCAEVHGPSIFILPYENTKRHIIKIKIYPI